jgi:hypothetical protein
MGARWDETSDRITKDGSGVVWGRLLEGQGAMALRAAMQGTKSRILDP